MTTEMGEYIVGAYLRIIKKCDFIDYNMRRIEGGLKGLDELDVMGLDFKNKITYLCEVTTHIRGLLYVNNEITIKRIKQKHQKQRDYANEYLTDFPERHFMFWSPVVPEGYLTSELAKITGLELVINSDYAQCVDKLRVKAGEMSNDTGNPFFRALQILEHLRR